ncbi:MAG: PAS domain-containing sensor histidine kinase [Patescibacteria group bacterium]|nr:PAS domain-containing sensor histidine kinase [Patescibacteria group bacterium]
MKMTANRAKREYTEAEIADLEARLQEAEDTLDAIRDGSVDALVTKNPQVGQQIYTLKSADYTYRVLIESMSQGALTISEEGIILYSNEQFSRMTATPLEHVIGQKIAAFVDPDDARLVAEILQQRSANVNGSERTVRLKGPHQKEVIFSARKLPSNGDNAFICLVVTDITERKRAETAKDEFIALASHQLRTPATGVKQYIGMLLEGYAGTLTESQRTFAQTAFDSNERQLAIINSILKTAQIDFGGYQLKIIKKNLADLVSESLKAFEPIVAMRNQTITCEFEPKVCALIEPMEISLVISNLIENASKYSSVGGKISIKIYKDPKHAYVAITDNGVGIHEEDQAKIFEKFTRVNNALSDTVSGSGLGLYWVKKIVELHGGEIILTSELDSGSTFIIKLRSC